LQTKAPFMVVCVSNLNYALPFFNKFVTIYKKELSLTQKKLR